MSKRKRARDECSICKANGTNAIGHLAQWCSYKDGPFEGNFKGAIKAKKESEKRAKKVKGLGGVASVDVYHLASDVRDLNEEPAIARYSCKLSFYCDLRAYFHPPRYTRIYRTAQYAEHGNVRV